MLFTGHFLYATVCLFFYEVSRRTTVGRTLRTSDQLVAETATWQQTLTTDRHSCPRWDSNPQPQHASGRRPTVCRPSSWDHIHVCWLPCAGQDTCTMRVVRCHAPLVFRTPHSKLRSHLYSVLIANCTHMYRHLILLDRKRRITFLYIAAYQHTRCKQRLIREFLTKNMSTS